MPYLPEPMVDLHNRPNSVVTKPVFFFLRLKRRFFISAAILVVMFSPAGLFLPDDSATPPYAAIAQPICSGHCIKHEDCKHTDNMPMRASLLQPLLFNNLPIESSHFNLPVHQGILIKGVNREPNPWVTSHCLSFLSSPFNCPHE